MSHKLHELDNYMHGQLQSKLNNCHYVGDYVLLVFSFILLLPQHIQAGTVKRIVMVAQPFSVMWSQAVVISQLLVWGRSVDHVLLASLEMESNV